MPPRQGVIMRRAAGVLALVLLTLRVGAGEPSRGPAPVCVVAAEVQDPRNSSASARTSTQDPNRASGKDIKKWPPEAKESLFSAYDEQQQGLAS